MPPETPDPLILTLALDPADQERFDALRRRHFPAARNHLGAHVTLFHALPGAALEAVTAVVAAAARRPAFALPVTRVRSLGRGVAYDLGGDELPGLHAALQRDLAAVAGEEGLTRQDAQRLSAHVTVQNKVTPAEARALHAELAEGFTPWTTTATGLALWHYRGGPWEAIGVHRFDDPEARDPEVP